MIRWIPFTSLIRQEVFRFWRLIKQTIFPPIITTLLFILIFGYSLGSRIQEISGLPYILFIFPGLLAMGVTNNAFSNTTTSIYMAMFDHSIDNLLAAPLSPIELVLAFTIGGVARAMLIGLVILAVALLMLHATVVHPLLLALYLLGSSTFFSCWGIIGAIRAKSWDSLATTTNFIITPMTYLGGVFYSIKLLPPLWQKVSLWNPLFYMVDGYRYAMTGVSDVAWATSFVVTWGLGLSFFILCIYLFKIGYRLVR